MIKLSKEFYITSIGMDTYWDSSRLNKKYKYNFRYKNFKVELAIRFTIAGHTHEGNMAIVNFGYAVNIEKWSDKEQNFSFIHKLDQENGKSTKQYLDSSEARALILKFIEKRINKYLKSESPAIIMRGALNDIQVNLPRYKRFDVQFLNHGYHKKEFDIKKSDSLYQLTYSKKDDDRVIWVYSKHMEYFDKLVEVFK